MSTSMRFLIVDDSSVMRRIAIMAIHSRLGVHNVQLFEADNGKQALAWLKVNEPVNVILMDWQMPEMSGLDCIKAIRETDSTTPIIMVTMQSDPDLVLEAIQAGANNYVLKPLNAEDLCERIRQVAGITV